MTELFEKAIRTARALPPEFQDDIARIVLSLADADVAMFKLSADEEASFARSRSEAARKQFATDQDVDAIWSKHGI
jgi:hypothetical protein